MSTSLHMALCEGRHEIPEATDGSIFGNVILNVTDTLRLEKDAWNKLWDVCYKKYTLKEGEFLISTFSEDEDMGGYRISSGNVHLNLYVTGLTVALIAVLNVCRREGISVTLWHYDRDSEKYFPQLIKY